MRTKFILPVAWLLAAALGCAQDVATKADQYVNAYARNGRFMGSILVAKGGNVVVTKGYGLADIELNVPNTPNTKFRLGSITKQFTATAILQLQERGKLTVNDLISKYIPDSPESWKEITIRHLLTHTSGVPNYTSFSDYRAKMTQP